MDAQTHVRIFRSRDPDAFARARAILAGAQLPFEVEETYEGGVKFPRRIFWITVPRDVEARAGETISAIPSEIIMTRVPAAVDSTTRFTAWVQFIILILMAVFALVTLLMNWL